MAFTPPCHIGGGGLTGARGSAFKVAGLLGCHVDSGCQLGAQLACRLKTRVPLMLVSLRAFEGFSPHHGWIPGAHSSREAGRSCTAFYGLALEVPSCHFFQSLGTFRFPEREPKPNLSMEEANHIVGRTGNMESLIEAILI